MNVMLWILQVLLAVAFFAHGWLLLAPPPDIAPLLLESLPRWFWVFLGVAEICAAIGITLPGVSRIQPWLVTWAAVGIMIVMVSATVWHLARAEWSSAVVTLLLLAMATFVAYGRTRLLPIRARYAATL
jgi:putative oxidoreductase